MRRQLGQGLTELADGERVELAHGFAHGDAVKVVELYFEHGGMVPTGRGRLLFGLVPHVLIASDADWVHAEIASVLAGPDTTFGQLRTGAEVLQNVKDLHPDLLVLDFQIGSMGAVATCLELRLEESARRLDHVAVLMLLDRRPDVFIASQSGAEGWIIKPIDPLRLRRAAATIMAGGNYHDATGQPAVLDAARS